MDVEPPLAKFDAAWQRWARQKVKLKLVGFYLRGMASRLSLLPSPRLSAAAVLRTWIGSSNDQGSGEAGGEGIGGMGNCCR